MAQKPKQIGPLAVIISSVTAGGSYVLPIAN